MLELNDLDSVRANEISSFTFRVSLKQIRSSSDTEFSVRVQFIPTHHTPI
jgi:hypothetical protein